MYHWFRRLWGSSSAIWLSSTQKRSLTGSSFVDSRRVVPKALVAFVASELVRAICSFLSQCETKHKIYLLTGEWWTGKLELSHLGAGAVVPDSKEAFTPLPFSHLIQRSGRPQEREINFQNARTWNLEEILGEIPASTTPVSARYPARPVLTAILCCNGRKWMLLNKNATPVRGQLPGRGTESPMTRQPSIPRTRRAGERTFLQEFTNIPNRRLSSFHVIFWRTRILPFSARRDGSTDGGRSALSPKIVLCRLFPNTVMSKALVSRFLDQKLRKAEI